MKCFSSSSVYNMKTDRSIKSHLLSGRVVWPMAVHAYRDHIYVQWGLELYDYIVLIVRSSTNLIDFQLTQYM